MTATRLDWSKLLSAKRLPGRPGPEVGQPDWLVVSRLETERDVDRILFASPVRRLGDKTQVFPLERNEHVRNRLTHSHEVSNLARSIGTHLVHSALGTRIVAEVLETLGSGCEERIRRSIPAILAATCLAHDLGNPPFGHQGENSIRDWLADREGKLFTGSSEPCFVSPEHRDAARSDIRTLGDAHRQDFLLFEGNAQTLRTVTRLQVVKDHRGLNLTFGTLAALMKYTVGSDAVRNNRPATKKVGYFASEAPLMREIWQETGLGQGVRHPLAYIMEACDDIAYSVVDAEDAVKKQIVSFHDLTAWLRRDDADDVVEWVLNATDAAVQDAIASKLPPTELNDVSMQLFRAYAITAMVSATITSFEQNYDAIMTGEVEKSLLDMSRAATLVGRLKRFDHAHAYSNRRVLELELEGHGVIHRLMTMLWHGITNRQSYTVVDSMRTTPFARYAYGRISENYRRVFEGKVSAADGTSAGLPIRYREMQLLTDMVAGMTEQFALDLHDDLMRLGGDDVLRHS
jgi:dGTPase